ncbi:hypothetical protein BVY04_04485 [bacterium M21]|nr:hypothetical protein BVY04_04485 [bacterium M21]
MTEQSMTLDAVQTSINALIDEVKKFASQSRTNMSSSGLKLVGEHAPHVTAYDVEKSVFEGLLHVGGLLMKHYFDELGDGNLGFRIEHQGEEMLRKVSGEVKVLTVFGKVPVHRWLYYKSGCPGYSPVEDTANIPDREASHYLQELVGRLGIRDTFDETAGFLEYLFGISLSTHTVHEIIGELADHHQGFAEELTPETAPAEATIHVASFDGKGVPVVKDVAPQLSSVNFSP